MIALRFWTCSCIALLTAAAANAGETVLFPFDDQALPFSKGLVLTMSHGKKSNKNPSLGVDPKHPSKPVLAIGQDGDPDFPRAYFCGTVVKVGDEYRMWYSGFSDDKRRQVCYAVSKDGVEWTKPKLGLADYRGSKENNLVSIDGEPMPGMIVLVLHDPEDPAPARRFKMIREVNPTNKPAAVSPDGLRWTSLNGGKDILDGGNMEPSGLVKHNGVYYLYGHGGPVPHPIPQRGLFRPQKRMMVTVASYDFDNWTLAGHVSFRRDNIPPRPVLDFEFHKGEQVHLGASVWNRGNVLLGFYGMYHSPKNDRREAYVDIGLVVSSDGIHFKEPVPDFQMVPSFEEEDRAEQRLTQGQAFENIGDRTYFYYGIWTEIDRNSPTGVRVAMWPRDRLGYFSPSLSHGADAHCISSPLTLEKGKRRVFLNATNMSDDAQLTVELLDEQFRPLEGYTAADFTPIKDDSGLKLPISWGKNKTVEIGDAPIRVRVNWSGRDAEEARLWAAYVE
jgi:hypothetical protein